MANAHAVNTLHVGIFRNLYILPEYRDTDLSFLLKGLCFIRVFISEIKLFK